MTPDDLIKLLNSAKGPIDVFETLAQMQRVYFNALVSNGFDEERAMSLVVTTTEAVFMAVTSMPMFNPKPSGES